LDPRPEQFGTLELAQGTWPGCWILKNSVRLGKGKVPRVGVKHFSEASGNPHFGPTIVQRSVVNDPVLEHIVDAVMPGWEVRLL
jgi:hypothetical protein